MTTKRRPSVVNRYVRVLAAFLISTTMRSQAPRTPVPSHRLRWFRRSGAPWGSPFVGTSARAIAICNGNRSSVEPCSNRYETLSIAFQGSAFRCAVECLNPAKGDINRGHRLSFGVSP